MQIDLPAPPSVANVLGDALEDHAVKLAKQIVADVERVALHPIALARQVEEVKVLLQCARQCYHHAQGPPRFMSGPLVSHATNRPPARVAELQLDAALAGYNERWRQAEAEQNARYNARYNKESP